MVRIDRNLCAPLVKKRSMFTVGLMILVWGCHWLHAATVSVPEEQPTIQAGIEATVDGDTVLVSSGTYTGTGNVNLDFKGKTITVKSVNGASTAIIDCQNQNIRGVYFHSGETFSSILDGFTITGGKATGVWPNNIGGGIYCNKSSPTIINCIIIGNQASNGGGILCAESSPDVVNCIITKNQAQKNGGGIYCSNNSSSRFINCTITNNQSEAGGGIYGFNNLSLTLINTIVWADSPQAIYFSDSGIPNEIAVSYSCVQDGQAGIVTNDNGIINWGNGNIDVDPIFVDANAGDYHLRDNSPCIGVGTITNAPKTDIEGNSRPDPADSNPDVGAYENSRSTPTDIIPPVVAVVTSPTRNGIYKEPDIIAITIIFSESVIVVKTPQLILETGEKDALVDYSSGSGTDTLTFAYTVAAGQNSSDLSYSADNALILNEGQIEDAAGNSAILILPVPGNTNSLSFKKGLVIDTSPPAIPVELVAIGSNGQVRLIWSANNEDDLSAYHIYGGSGSDLIPFLARVAVGTEKYTHLGLDNGATYYYQISALDNVGNESDRASHVSALPQSNKIRVPQDQSNIQAGIDAAVEGETVVVSDGTYAGIGNVNLDFKGKMITVKSVNGAGATIIDCQGQYTRGFYFRNRETPLSVLDGFTITRGNAIGVWPNNVGGGIYFNNSSPTIANCIIVNNRASNGAGILCGASSPKIVNCIITDNQSDKNGGGVFCSANSSPDIINCKIIGNQSVESGGGIYCNDSSPTITNCVIVNSQAQSGSGIFCASSSPRLINCTFTSNQAENGGGVFCSAGSSPAVFNTIFWENSPQEIYFGIGKPNTINISFSDVQGGELGIVTNDNGIVNWGDGNIRLSTLVPDVDPLFVDPVSGDYHLRDNSLCIGAGTVEEVPQTDIEGNYRGSPPDIGAYENPLNVKVFMIIRVPQDQLKIQTAIDLTVNGDVVLVDVGTYKGPGNVGLDFLGKAITVRSVSGAVSTIIDCQGQDVRGVYFRNGEEKSSILEGFTIVKGGGIFCDNSSPLIISCRITGNTTQMGGSGIFCQNGSSPIVKNCVITGNQSSGSGGGVFCSNGSSPIITGCTISNNRAQSGGGIFCYDKSDPNVTDCIITNNQSVRNGGGIYCKNSSPFIDNCTIADNQAIADDGGGILCKSKSSPHITNCIITTNRALNGSGILCHNSSDPTVINCLIVNNRAQIGGGGVLCDVNSSPTFINCTVVGNQAEKGGGVYSQNNSSPTVINTIFWADSPQEIYFGIGRPSTISISYSDVQGGEAGVVTNDNGVVNWGDGNIRTSSVIPDSDPLFVDTINGDYHLLDDSLCIGMGTVVDVSNDIEGNVRGIPPDIGAYENALNTRLVTTIRVPQDKSTIQAGINAATRGDTVLVADGVYTGKSNVSLDFIGKSITVKSVNGASSTIIDCQGQNTRGFYFRNGETEISVLDGFTVTNGNGVYCNNSSPTIVNCTMTNNQAQNGAGIVCYSNSSPTIINCVLTNNQAQNGAGVYCENSSPNFTNCTIAGNHADSNGGGVFCNNSALTVINCTITENQAKSGGGIYGISNVLLTVINTILWGDSSQEMFLGVGRPSAINIAYSNVQDGQLGIVIEGNSTVNWGDGNIDVDPLFVDAVVGDYLLMNDSFCIGAGTNIGTPLNDILGNPRGASPDIGAYENPLDFKLTAPIRIPQDQPTIQAGIDKAIDGDTVLVADGMYTGFGNANLDLKGKAITVRSINGATSTIIDCQGQDAGGFYFRSSETQASVLDGFTITNGSGIYCNNSSPTITNCIMIDNQNINGGGIFCGNNSSPRLINCVVANNRAQTGGGIYSDGSSPKITNCTITENFADNGGGIFCDNDSSVTIIGTIIWENRLDEFSFGDGESSLIYISYSNVQASISYNGRGKVKWGEGNINADPSFVDARNYHIKDNSSCIGAGATQGIPLTDIEGNYRGAPPDIGAYENSLNRRQVLSIRVPQDQPTIQAGIDVAVNDDIILVDDGVYKGEGNVGLDFKGKAITVRSVNGSASTIIDCQNLYNSGFLFHNGETQSSVLRGFTITKSKAESGGGIYCENASPTISKCVIIDNQTSNGGGIYCINNSSPNVVDCVITNNLVSRNGGGIYASNNSTPSVTRCTISDNRASSGGGIYCINNSSSIIVNCVVASNRVSGNGGGIYCGASSPSVINCTISSNWASNGSGIFCRLFSSPILINTIVWGEIPQAIYFSESGISNEITVSYSNVQGGQAGIVTNSNGIINWGDGNIDVDPLFVDASAGDYHLKDNNPCFGVGIPENTLKTDIEGSSRPNPIGSNPDMGAYENSHGIPTDVIAPVVTSVSSPTGNGIYKESDIVVIAITFSESVTVGGTLQLILETGEKDAVVDYSGGSGTSTLTFIYMVASGQNSNDLGYNVDNALILNGGRIEDAAGNSAILALPVPGDVKSLSFEKELKIDTSPPATPVGLTTISGNNHVKLVWAANNEDDISAYQVYGRTNSDGFASLAKVIVGTDRYTHLGLTNGTIYYYRISAVDNVGNESDKTGYVSALPQSNEIRVPQDQLNIQAGIDAAVDGDNVLVSDGTYTGAGNVNLDFKGKAITVKSVNGAGATIIDCRDQYTRGFYFRNGETPLSVLDGFTITRGNATGVWPSNVGGGIYFNNSSPTITNCIIVNNQVARYGGGVFCYDSSSPYFINCVIVNNRSLGNGGAIYCMNDSSPIVVNCNITNNRAVDAGGAIFCYDGSLPSLINCTIADNLAQRGIGIYCSASSSPRVVNTVLWGSLLPQIYFSENDRSNTISISYSDVQGGKLGIETNGNGTVNWGDSNIDVDPLFTSSADGDYRLKVNSPCIGAGTLESGTNIDLRDYAGGSMARMGVYGNRLPSVTITSNSNPVANGQTIRTVAGSLIEFELTGNDSDGDQLTYTIVGHPSNGKLSGTSPKLTYTPKANFYGTDTFTFKANDGTNDSNIGIIVVDVGSISDSVVTASRAVLGDVNGDNSVNIFDLVQVALQFGQIGDNLIGDVNQDSFVNLLDLVQVTRNFGQILSAPAVLSNKSDFSPSQKKNIQLAVTELEKISRRSENEELVLNVLKPLSMSLPDQTLLQQNYPNPFNPETWIPFELSRSSKVTIVIYNVVGIPIRTIRVGYVEAGSYVSQARAIYWDGKTDTGGKAASGIYFYTLRTRDYASTQKMVILK